MKELKSVQIELKAWQAQHDSIDNKLRLEKAITESLKVRNRVSLSIFLYFYISTFIFSMK